MINKQILMCSGAVTIDQVTHAEELELLFYVKRSCSRLAGIILSRSLLIVTVS